MNITTATPVEIDTALYALYAKAADILAKQHGAERLIRVIDATEAGSYASYLPERSPQRRAELVAEAEALATEYVRIYADEVLPLDDEYLRRGRWTRYFLVDNTNGHVHKDQACDTCFPTTQYSWLIEQSGMSAEGLVELAGEKACTRCFPWAPVDTLKRKTLLESVDKKAARLEREAKKAEREAKKAAKGITTPEGAVLYADKESSSYMKVESLRTAEIAATDALLDLIQVQRQAKNPEFSYMFRNGRTEAVLTKEIALHAWCLLRSIAAKKGLGFQEVFATHEKKAQAKLRKMEREWAKDFRNPDRIKPNA
uniref:Uncharacterized protein n=1 Tax=Streptomyces sp. NBC_01393 TaxID=2903851 RepID=A0AAU3IA12_9ACTN